MRLFRAIPLVIACLVPGGCGGLIATRTFAPIGDYEASNQPSSAEGGHTALVVPPAGLTWDLEVLGFDEGGRSTGGARQYEMHIALTDRGVAPGQWRSTPGLDDAVLVDDEGNRFRCTRAVLPEPPKDPRRERDTVPSRVYTLVFDVPPGYRFRQIGTIAVHWSLRLGEGSTLPMTSRFRAV